MNRVLRRSLSIILSLTMVSSMTAVAVTSASASTVPEDANVGEQNQSDSKGKSYSLDEIYTDYLFSHTDKSSKVEYEGEIKNEVANANSDQVYADFHFSNVPNNDGTSSGSNDSMSKRAEKDLNDENSSNPLAGYSVINPDEFLFGQINRNEQHKGSIYTFNDNDMEIDEYPSGDIDNLPKVYDNINFDEKHQTQTHNTMGIDYNGDGADELAYFSLYTDKGEDNTFVSVTIYDREEKKDDSDVKYSWKKVGESEKKISKGNEFLDMMCQESKGYVAMAAGDYDHDGYEELACYFPCENKGYGEPFVGIIDINEENGTFDFEKDMKIIKLSEIRDQFSNLQSGKDSYESWHLPIVSLSTTSIRANEENVDTTKSYDDLVINVSVPRNYHDDNDNMNSCTAIYSYNEGTKSYECKFNQDTKFGTERMLSTNSVDADLNGDGYNELVVAGMRETGLNGTNENSTGKIETGNNLVQLIYWNGSDYNFVWDTPKQVQASVQVQVDRHSQEPIAITAGRYNPNTINTMDYLCIQGVVLSCKDAKVYGVESVSANETDINKAVITTLPHHEKELFTDASFVTEYKLDFDGIANKNAFISTADSGFFNTKSQVQTIALLTGDESTTDDIIYYDIIFLTCDSDGNWHKRAYNDIIGYEDEDDHGTYMSINFLDCDEDQVYYRYKGKSIGYSSPTLFSVIQAPPYYKEANSASASYTITHGHTDGTRTTAGVGGDFSVGAKTKFFEASLSVIAKYTYTHTESQNITTSTTLNLKSDQDYAVSFVIPTILNHYEVIDPQATNEEDKYTDMIISEELDPIFAALSLDEYNSLAKDLEDEKQREVAPVIDNLPKSTPGDPQGYCASSSELNQSLTGGNTEKIAETELRVDSTTTAKSNSIGITNTSERIDGFNISNNDSVKIAGVTFQFSSDLGEQWISSSSEGMSFSVSYNGIPVDDKVSIKSSTSDSYADYKDNLGNHIDSNIYHYNNISYSYTTSAVVYPSSAFTTQKTTNKIYLMSYYTRDFGGTPAELPEYFGVQSVTQNADGTYNITLAWKTSVKNEKRTPNAYNIYVESLNSKDKDLSLVNTEGPIMRNKGSIIMTYEAKNLSNPDKDFNFYIAAATTSVTSSKVMNVRESILMPAKTINVNDFLATDGLVITSQPESLYIDNVGQDAVFSIEVEDTKKDALNISYQWQTYNSKSGKWNPVTNNTSTEPNTYKFTTTADIIGTPIRCVVTKTKSSSEHFTAISDIVTVFSKENHNHDYDEDGFCKICDRYEPAKYNKNIGAYEIGNAGQLFWFAALVNGDHTHADFSIQDSDANAVLTKNIDLEGREWKPINNYSGNFDGNNHSISNLSITQGGENIGLFGSVNEGTISNLTLLSGSVSPHDSCRNVGSLIGEFNGGTVTNIISYLDIDDTESSITYIGGIVGSMSNASAYKCMNFGNINITHTSECIGGIAGCAYDFSSIDNCANIGNLKGERVGVYIGGILGYSKEVYVKVKNCYNYGNVSNSELDTISYCGAIIGRLEEYISSNISNNYYLIGSANSEFGEDIPIHFMSDAKRKYDFDNGEVTYLLNHSQTDGSQVWYQNIDNGKTPDPYPVFVGGTVYSKGNDEYTNYDPNHKDDEFKKDENGNFIIEEYNDLVKLSELVRSDYKYYGSESYILANNIVAKADSKWTQGIGSVSENKPFNGTFNGNGHYISGLNVDSPEYGGLFESIGDKGKVENLFLIDCDYITQSKVAGSIAAVNNGTIDHCLSGVNLTSGSVTIGNIHISPELNSLILGDLSGGVAGINNGTITGTRNAAIVMGTNCGGIAGENNGTIFGSANNGTIGKYKKEFADLAGGLAGTNNGIIKSSYNSEITDTTNKTYGSVAGVNNTSDVHNVHALCSNGIKFIGSGVALDSTNVSYSDYHDMRGESFAKIMNSATNSESIVWVSNELLNKGYPTIQIVDFSTRTIDGGNGIILKGAAHDELNITYNTTDSDEFNQLKADNKGKVLGTYSVSLTDKNGNYVPAELWCKENFEMSVPVDRSNIQLASIGEDGSISYYKPVKIENGKATFNVPYPTSFAIVETSDNSTNDTVTPSDSTPIKTGAVVCTALFAILVLSGAVFITVKRRNRFE